MLLSEGVHCIYHARTVHVEDRNACVFFFGTYKVVIYNLEGDYASRPTSRYILHSRLCLVGLVNTSDCSDLVEVTNKSESEGF